MAEQKFQLRYSSSEDRVLIISGVGAGETRSFALTRRMVRQLWPGMNRIVQLIDPDATARSAAAAVQSETSTTAAEERAAMKDEDGGPPAAGASAGQPATPAESQAGPAPVATPPETNHLVRKLQLADRGGGKRLLVLTSDDAVLRVPLDEVQLAQIYEALRTVIERADWGIDLDQGLPQDTGPENTSVQHGSDIDITADSPSRYRH